MSTARARVDEQDGEVGAEDALDLDDRELRAALSQGLAEAHAGRGVSAAEALRALEAAERTGR